MMCERKVVRFMIFILPALIAACTGQKAEERLSHPKPIFQAIPASQSGINFANTLQHNERINTYTYRNFYNGAGVAVGDINNDGLMDLYFAGNQVDNKLYLNKGNFTFEDITETAGLACPQVWSTGVSMADVNGDGLLDIYVCKSGPPDTPNRNNELFINNGDLTFTEMAHEYGVADKGLSNHAAFFDYDRDGDLDMYLLNNSLRSIGIYDLRDHQREIRDPEGGNKLYRNDGERFTDVSEQAGIYGSAIGFGLGVTIADVNKDLWPDIFVSNDFFERDYLYINRGDGTFEEGLTEYMNEISMGSMGADIADLNNDTYPDIYVSEMLPASLQRVKTKTLFEDWDKYQADVANGYFHQFTRNAFQINNGPIPGNENRVFFSEVSRLTGTHATDWSWGALLFDADNNGYRDIFVANGIYKDLTDQDYVNFYSNNEILISRHKQDSTLLTTLIDKIPSVPLNNFLFLNQGDMKFTEQAVVSGIDQKGFSNGAVYADLDNDGALDLILNNINEVASIYRNLDTTNHFLQIQLLGSPANSAAFGTQIYAYAGGQVFFAEQYPVKGYMSSMDPRVHMGLGKHEILDSLIILWPDGKKDTMVKVETNRHITLEYREYLLFAPPTIPEKQARMLNAVSVDGLADVEHHENNFSDFNRDRLLYEMYSNEGPGSAAGDLNGDGLDDFILGGSSGEALSVYLQNEDGSFERIPSEVFEQDRLTEDVEIVVFDAENDGDEDIYVAGGGNEFSFGDFLLKDRIYLNDGNGGFSRSGTFTIAPAEATGFVLAIDYDSDGDTDIITGTRMIPFKYGVPGSAHVFRNEGNGNFRDVTKEVAPEFASLGLLTGAVYEDLNANGKPEIVMTGEWMKPRTFEWNGDRFEETDLLETLPSGLYKSVSAADINLDGRMDLVFGNYGSNTRLKASKGSPLTWNIADYDGNGRLDHILSVYEADTLYPLNLLQDISKQLPSLRKKFQTFDAYKNASTAEVLQGMEKSDELVLKAEELESFVWMNDGGNGYVMKLPWQAQLSPVYAILPVVSAASENVSLFLGGNQTRVKPELGIYNASYGVCFTSGGDTAITYVPHQESGFWIRGEIRNLIKLKIRGKDCVIAVRNNDRIKIWEIE
ncbi:VCBS repeat-containing protein [Fulvivirga sedimenti]|uniref:VCBS repeat-containing protein n=1 Tax=Fulvivirga sedimenti TaxID=2879465 RepID=A0A9X1HYS2_9BACT|nr:VCBS repeat-containing protein [Fulvivirga sedimenti]MCA6079182.1 VCBS repeat-containing protein [Fulvivirga sedimenti]